LLIVFQLAEIEDLPADQLYRSADKKTRIVIDLLDADDSSCAPEALPVADGSCANKDRDESVAVGKHHKLGGQVEQMAARPPAAETVAPSSIEKMQAEASLTSVEKMQVEASSNSPLFVVPRSFFFPTQAFAFRFRTTVHDLGR
jgi:hypothetical protein